MNKPRIINFLGGPGVGKSTLAAHTYCELKFCGINAEYVPEYAKQLVWEGRTGKVFAAQDYIFAKQHFSALKAFPEVDLIVTDACLLNTLVYTPDDYPIQKQLKAMAVEAYNQFDNLNIFVLRSKEYNTAGRTQTREEAAKLDSRIANMLNEVKTEFHVMNYGRDVAQKVIKIMQAKKWLQD